MTTNPFQKATRAQLKARVALEGPTGAGKTWTALEWATVLAAGAPIAVIDTERGSASLYSDRFEFDVVTFEPPYEPQRLTHILKAAETHGYAAVVIDSLSHFWEGEGGTLDMVDAAASRSGGNQFAGWKVGTPALRHLVDTMLGLDAHVIATMRSKMEYVLSENERGKKVPQKVGMAPVMRAGVEYEFTLVGDLDLEHRLTITKSRCDLLADQVVQPGRAAEAAESFMGWLGEGEPLAAKAEVDALVGRMNALPDAARRDCKASFVEEIGSPGSLRQSQLSAATGLVSRFEGAGGDEPSGSAAAPPPPDSQDPGGTSAEVPSGAHSAPPAPAADVTGGGQAPVQSTADTVEPPEAAIPAAPSGDVTLKEANPSGYNSLVRYCRKMKAEHFNADKAVADAQWEALAWAASGGRTVQVRDLTPDEAGTFRTRCGDLADGRGRLVETDDPTFLGWTVELVEAEAS